LGDTGLRRVAEMSKTGAVHCETVGDTETPQKAAADLPGTFVPWNSRYLR